MAVFSIILFAAAAVFLALGIAVHRGHTQLIHDYHQTNVRESDRQIYGRAFAKGLFSLCATLFISGALALLSKNGFVAAMLILAVGLVASAIVLFRVQKKYNRGLF